VTTTDPLPHVVSISGKPLLPGGPLVFKLLGSGISSGSLLWLVSSCSDTVCLDLLKCYGQGASPALQVMQACGLQKKLLALPSSKPAIIRSSTLYPFLLLGMKLLNPRVPC